ncbi:hypothetical protein IG631_22640 [Alternaria alternata]|nr:hypothetical protein IG631_22640 [Alternaria alternata]
MLCICARQSTGETADGFIPRNNTAQEARYDGLAPSRGRHSPKAALTSRSPPSTFARKATIVTASRAHISKA